MHILSTTAGDISAEYFIVDDVIDSAGHEGFIVMEGDPWGASGFDCYSARTLRECLAYLLPHITRGERVYRVRLARRHGQHKVSVLLGWHHAPFREHGLWQARGFDANGKHFNRAFRTLRACKAFLAQKRRGESTENY